MFPRNDPDPADWAREAGSLADLEAAVLNAALPLAGAYGWTQRLVLAAGRQVGLDAAETELLLPHGPRDLAALLARRHDDLGLTGLGGVDPATLKIRQRIARAVKARLDAADADGEATRRWAGYLFLPHNAPLTLSLVWRSADAIWRWAGDTATDENHYSKRAILGGVLATALPIRLRQGRAAAEAYVDARIENVMRFERWKAGVRPGDLGRDLAAALGRLRYGRG